MAGWTVFHAVARNACKMRGWVMLMKVDAEAGQATGALPSRSWIGPGCLDHWRESTRATGRKPKLDVVLLTHPRDESDVARLIPWAKPGMGDQDAYELTRILKPMFGEIIQFSHGTVGVMFVPRFGREMVDPATRHECRQMVDQEALPAIAAAGAAQVCLGGLIGGLTKYGERIRATAERLNLEVTTGHAATAISIVQLYRKSLSEMRLRASDLKVAVLGVGSVGAAVARGIVQRGPAPGALTLIDIPQKRGRLDVLAGQYRRLGIETEVEVTNTRGQLAEDTACYDADVIICAVSTANVLDVDRVRPGTILIDDSQPHCFSRKAAWARLERRGDIVPCDAGLVQSNGIGWRSFFDFGFADNGPEGSVIAWSCLVEGMLRLMRPGTLPSTIGEPAWETFELYFDAFEWGGFGAPTLQCDARELPIDRLRERFAGADRTMARRA